MAIKLIGLDDTTIGTPFSSDNVAFSRFQALETGTITEIRVKAVSNLDVKVAIYTDDGVYPVDLITANNTPQACVNGMNVLSISATPVVKDSWYWLGIAVSAAGTGTDDTQSVALMYTEITFSTYTFPSSAGTSYTGYDHGIIMAGWGGVGNSPLPTFFKTF